MQEGHRRNIAGEVVSPESLPCLHHQPKATGTGERRIKPASSHRGYLLLQEELGICGNAPKQLMCPLTKGMWQ